MDSMRPEVSCAVEAAHSEAANKHPFQTYYLRCGFRHMPRSYTKTV